jgi:TRAP-type C4-dicarboxylate transport system substrate-binding protein
MVDKPIRTAADLRGVKMRVPDGQMSTSAGKDVFGATAWGLLERDAGRLG